MSELKTEKKDHAGHVASKYIIRENGKKEVGYVLFENFIMNVPWLITHKDGDPSNNTKANLEVHYPDSMGKKEIEAVKRFEKQVKNMV